MKKIVIILLVFFAFSWISVVSADNSPVKGSPESVVTCMEGEGTYWVLSRSISDTVSMQKCGKWSDQPPSPCASCITSLEGQGCKIVDVYVTHLEPYQAMTTYLLSCDGR